MYIYLLKEYDYIYVCEKVYNLTIVNMNQNDKRIQIASISQLQELLDPSSRGSAKLTQILKYLCTHNNSTQYSLAQELYGSGIKFNRNAKNHIKRLQKVKGIIKTNKRNGKILISLTEGGKLLCQELGLVSSSLKAQIILSELNAGLKQPLSKSQINQGLDLLTDRSLEGVADIFYKLVPCAGKDRINLTETLDSDMLITFLASYEQEINSNHPKTSIISNYLVLNGIKAEIDLILQWANPIMKSVRTDITKWVDLINWSANQTRPRLMNKEEFAPCGLCCSSCACHQISCRGCKFEPSLQSTCRIAKCCITEKRLVSCVDCSNFPCSDYSVSTSGSELLHAFWSLQKIKEIGWDEWLIKYPRIFIEILQERIIEYDEKTREGAAWGLRHISLKFSSELSKTLSEWYNSEDDKLKRGTITVLNRLVIPAMKYSSKEKGLFKLSNEISE
jgi:hypothetical protein